MKEETVVIKKEPTPTNTATSPAEASPSEKKKTKTRIVTGKSSIVSFFLNNLVATKPAAPKPVEKPVENLVEPISKRGEAFAERGARETR